MKALITEQQFLVLYDRYLNGQSLQSLAEENWDKFGYASVASFRLAFRKRVTLKGYPLRDPAASRKKPRKLRTKFKGKLTREQKEYLKQEISKHQIQFLRSDRKSKIWP